MSSDSDLRMEESRQFSCPGCSGRVTIARETTSGEFYGMHTHPPCKHFEKAETIEAILGPTNFAIFGEPPTN